ncbi:AAA family ATPase [Shewanella sp. SG44-2]|uniref:AAA family ATPase n=1 Tax=Shewanella sp. SG44-2 TaxID=2760962 RepID=UPI001602D4D2|nr:AAA family ATPase [Shewanella sp. SG44-2]MBB1426372.1 AAA family ATPase [Shewanella sp. SG44-2]
MRLKSIFISEYKNLYNFTVCFSADNLIEIFVGRNGSGKSNFIEALLEIFRHIYEYGHSDVEGMFDYDITYEVDGSDINIAFKSGYLSVNGKPASNLNNIVIPDHILVYYSGHNGKVSSFVDNYENKFSSKLKNANANYPRRFIGVGNNYKELLLSIVLLQQENNKAREFLLEKLAIESIENEFILTLKRPNYAINQYGKRRQNFDIESNDDKARYWHPVGITKKFLDELSTCITKAQGEVVRTEGYLWSEDRYKLYIDIELLRLKFKNISPEELFKHFDNLKALGMLESITVPLVLIGGRESHISQLSDGQLQSVYIYTISELFKNSNCLILMDEPDSFLHPDWQFEFLKQVDEISFNAKRTNHIVISSHSASTVMSYRGNKLNCLSVDSNLKSTHYLLDKSNAINWLSNNKIFLEENQTIMSISTFLKNSQQPVLFTEGISDEYILDIAWRKLYQTQPRPFCIHNAFDRHFLRNLMSRDELRLNHSERLFFALFDFDDAYDDWNGISSKGKGKDIEADPFNGLTRQMLVNGTETNQYVILLPVPNVEAVKRQVLKADNTPWGKGSDSHMAIELLFYKEELIDTYFKKEQTSGGGELIVFNGNKVQFAQDFIPNLEPVEFEIFRPMFELIKSTITAGINSNAA